MKEGSATGEADRQGGARWLLAALAVLILAAVAKAAWTLSTAGMAVNDDQRQHIVPFRHFLPGNPLPRDEIVDFFLSENAGLLRLTYAVPASLGVSPTGLAWFVGLAAGLLSLVAIHRLMRACGASPFAAAAAALMLFTYLGLRGDLPTGSARALGWPILLCALWGFAERRRLLFAFAATAGVFAYPTVTVIVLAAAGLALTVELARSRSVRPTLAWAPALLLPAVLLLLLWSGEGRWGAAIAAEVASRSPEFRSGGRVQFFVNDPIRYWITGPRSGLLDPFLLQLPFILLLAPVGLAFGRGRGRLTQIPLALAAASLLLWAAAHLLLFRLYLPARFATYGLSVAAILLAAHALAGAAERWRAVKLGAVAVLAGWPLLLLLGAFPRLGLAQPAAPRLIAAVRNNPTPGQVAGLSYELDFVPRFTDRSVYWSPETALPYRVRYREFVSGRLGSTLDHLFSARPEPLLAWAEREKIAFLLIDAEHLAPGAKPLLVSGAAGGSAGPPRESWPKAWIARQGACALRERGVLLFDVACLRGAPQPPRY